MSTVWFVRAEYSYLNVSHDFIFRLSDIIVTDTNPHDHLPPINVKPMYL